LEKKARKKGKPSTWGESRGRKQGGGTEPPRGGLLTWGGEKNDGKTEKTQNRKGKEFRTFVLHGQKKNYSERTFDQRIDHENRKKS